MSRPTGRIFDRVRFLDEATDDVLALAARSRPGLLEVFRVLKALDLGQLAPAPLHDYAKTGDLSDRGKIVVSVEGEPEYRVVVREVAGGIDVVDVIAVEDRTDDLPYLLAGIRSGRITDPVRRSDTQRRIARIQSLREEG